MLTEKKVLVSFFSTQSYAGVFALEAIWRWLSGPPFESTNLDNLKVVAENLERQLTKGGDSKAIKRLLEDAVRVVQFNFDDGVVPSSHNDLKEYAEELLKMWNKSSDPLSTVAYAVEGYVGEINKATQSWHDISLKFAAELDSAIEECTYEPTDPSWQTKTVPTILRLCRGFVLAMLAKGVSPTSLRHRCLTTLSLWNSAGEGKTDMKHPTFGFWIEAELSYDVKHETGTEFKNILAYDGYSAIYKAYDRTRKSKIMDLLFGKYTSSQPLDGFSWKKKLGKNVFKKFSMQRDRDLVPSSRSLDGILSQWNNDWRTVIHQDYRDIVYLYAQATTAMTWASSLHLLWVCLVRLCGPGVGEEQQVKDSCLFIWSWFRASASWSPCPDPQYLDPLFWKGDLIVCPSVGNSQKPSLYSETMLWREHQQFCSNERCQTRSHGARLKKNVDWASLRSKIWRARREKEERRAELVLSRLYFFRNEYAHEGHGGDHILWPLWREVEYLVCLRLVFLLTIAPNSLDEAISQSPTKLFLWQRSFDKGVVSPEMQEFLTKYGLN